MADPVISTSPSSATDAESITITGLNFGVHTDNAPTESYINAAWTDFEADLEAGIWETGFTGPELVIGGSSQRLNSTRCARGSDVVVESYTNVFGDVVSNWNPSTLFHSNEDGEGAAISDILFISGWFMMDSTYMTTLVADTINAQCKFISSLTSSGQGGNQYWNWNYGNGSTSNTRENFEDGRISFNPSELSFTGPSGNSVLNADEWHRYDLELDLTGGLGTAYSKFYVDGKNYTPENKLLYLELPTFESSFFYRYFQGTLDGFIYLDAAFVDNTKARIEISDNSTWDETTRNHLEIQIPTAWSDTSITFDANQGSFPEDTQLYLYVKNAADEVNASGIPITFGGAATATATGMSFSGVSVS